MSYTDTPQTIANALAYLQHHLYEETKWQNNSETNINNTLAALIVQLQQLMQLVSNTQPAPLVVASSLLPTPTTPTPVAPHSHMHPKLSSPLDFHGD